MRVAAVDKAEVAFKRANELTKGKVAEIHKLLAKIYSDQKRYREAADQLELYLKTTSNAQDDAQLAQHGAGPDDASHLRRGRAVRGVGARGAWTRAGEAGDVRADGDRAIDLSPVALYESAVATLR